MNKSSGLLKCQDDLPIWGELNECVSLVPRTYKMNKGPGIVHVLLFHEFMHFRIRT